MAVKTLLLHYKLSFYFVESMFYSLCTILNQLFICTLQSQVWWAASDLGWIVGHSYITYAPLLAGCTTVLYEVDTLKCVSMISHFPLSVIF